MWGQVRLGQFEMSFPQPRLPRLIGSDRDLAAGNSVYPVVKLDVPFVPQVATIVAGAVAAVIPIDLTIVNAWATRFATLFREYAICGAHFEIRPNNIANTAGIVKVFIDEQSAAAPTAADAVDRPSLDVTCGPIFEPRAYRLGWKPADILDLDYVSTATTFTPAWLKVLATVANTFTSAATTGQVLVTGTFACQFRGYV